MIFYVINFATLLETLISPQGLKISYITYWHHVQLSYLFHSLHSVLNLMDTTLKICDFNHSH